MSKEGMGDFIGINFKPIGFVSTERYNSFLYGDEKNLEGNDSTKPALTRAVFLKSLELKNIMKCPLQVNWRSFYKVLIC